MNDVWEPSSHDEGEFGPGAALVLSLFAVFLLVAALAWRDIRSARAAAPTTLATIAESGSADGFFEAGQAALTPAAQATVTRAAAAAIQRVRADRQRRIATLNHLQVIGYASPEGKRNQGLAAERAMAVRSYLVDHLHVPDDCVVVASYADSHSVVLRRWERSDRSVAAFKKMSTDEQRRALGVSEDVLGRERRVSILGVFHSDSTCRLDLVAPPNVPASVR